MSAGDQPRLTKALRSHRASRLPSNPGSRDNGDNNVRRHRTVGAEAAHEITQNIPDQAGTVVLIGIGDGGIAAPFEFYSFIHPAASS